MHMLEEHEYNSKRGKVESNPREKSWCTVSLELSASETGGREAVMEKVGNCVIECPREPSDVEFRRIRGNALPCARASARPGLGHG